MSSIVGSRLFPTLCPLILCVILGPPPTAWADEIIVKGTPLRGKVVNMTPAGVEFETEYGSGKITIPFESIDSITTDKPLFVVHGDEGETEGKVLGVEDGKILVGDSVETAERIDISTLIETDTQEEMEHWYERLRNDYRYWTANLNAGFSYKESTSDEVDLALGFQVERRKKPTRLLGTVTYLYGRDKQKGVDAVTTDNEILGLLRGEYDFTDRFYSFASNDFEYDEIERLSLRWVGKLGPGYRFFKNERAELSADLGIAYVYKRFFGGDTEDYPGVSFGTSGEVKMPLGSTLNYRADYLPSLDDWTVDYIIRGQATLAYPLTNYFSLRVTFIDIYDNTPDSTTARNEFRTLVALAWIL